MTADDLDVAVSSVVAGLGPGTSLDWSARAGGLEWDCWHTAEHIGDGLLSFWARFMARPGSLVLRFESSGGRNGSPEKILETVRLSGNALSTSVRRRPGHRPGQVDAAGFAAMGCVEALVHGDDIASGLGMVLDPPRDVCARVLARLFPEAARELAGVDPWAALRWSTGRIALPGRPRLVDWAWRAAPLVPGHRASPCRPRMHTARRRSRRR